jgi:putative transcriptional regulator
MFEFTPEEVVNIRKKCGLTQHGFSEVFGININTLRHWEYGQRKPTTSAQVLLKIIQYDPEHVLKALKPK